VHEPVQDQTPKIIIKEILNEIIESVIIPRPSKVKKPVSNKKKIKYQKTFYFFDKISKMGMKLF
jgi:hypothetical protein